jgi:hypothetical protein
MGGEEGSVQAGLRRFYERSEYATLDFAAWAQYCFAEWDGPLLDEALRPARGRCFWRAGHDSA